MDFYMMDTPDWVNIVPLSNDEAGRPCFLMVRQFRPGAGKLSLEFPGGLIDRGEVPELAARRELLEETGHEAGDLSLIGSTNPNPAIMTNRVSTFLARDLRRVSDLKLDQNEVLDAVLVPVEEVRSGRAREFGVNGIMMIALGWYLRWEREQE